MRPRQSSTASSRPWTKMATARLTSQNGRTSSSSWRRRPTMPPFANASVTMTRTETVSWSATSSITSSATVKSDGRSFRSCGLTLTQPETAGRMSTRRLMECSNTSIPISLNTSASSSLIATTATMTAESSSSKCGWPKRMSGTS